MFPQVNIIYYLYSISSTMCQYYKFTSCVSVWVKGKGKDIPRQAEVALGVPGRLSSQLSALQGW